MDKAMNMVAHHVGSKIAIAGIIESVGISPAKDIVIFLTNDHPLPMATVLIFRANYRKSLNPSAKGKTLHSYCTVQLINAGMLIMKDCELVNP
jgi:hypothetical protein